MSFHSLPTQCSALLRSRLVGKTTTTTSLRLSVSVAPNSPLQPASPQFHLFSTCCNIQIDSLFRGEKYRHLVVRASITAKSTMTLWLRPIIWLLNQGVIMHHIHMWCLRTLLFCPQIAMRVTVKDSSCFESQKSWWRRCMYIAADWWENKEAFLAVIFVLVSLPWGELTLSACADAGR